MEGLIRRSCPMCGSDSHTTLVELTQDAFTKSNPSYRLERLPELELDPSIRYPMVECNQCEMIFSLYHLDDRREAIVYEGLIDIEFSKAKVMQLGRRISNVRTWLEFLELLDDPHDTPVDLKVGDYGCGWATLLQEAKGSGVQVFGFDVTSWKVDWARQHGVTVYTTEEELVAQAPFDLVICTSVLEHVHNPAEVIGKLRSMVRPGGYGYITAVIPTTVEKSDWQEIRRKLEQGIMLRKEINPWEHLNYFTRHRFAELLGEGGFHLVQPKQPSGGLLSNAKQLLGSRQNAPYEGFWRRVD